MTRLAACLVLVLAQGQGRPGSWSEAPVARMDRPAAQLAHARRMKRVMFARRGEDRAFWRTLTVEAYRAVRHFHPDASELGAEAAFRAGELLRAGQAFDQALEEFRVARDLGRGTPFVARAGLEAGHVQRRVGRPRQALDHYLAVAGDASAEPRHRDEAWLWAGRVWSAQGRADDARRAWRGVAEGDGDPLDRIRAYDELGLSWIREGDLERAAALARECAGALADAALEETELGRRTRSALLSLRTAAELEERARADASSRRP